MANSDRTRKLLTRTALVTSTTIATLVGAQNLAMLDATQLNLDSAPVADNTLIQPASVAAEPVAAQAAPSLQIIHAAPSLTILRGPASQSDSAAANTASIIQPPNPVALSTPEPIVVQPPPQIIVQPQVSQSSRPSRSVSRSSR